VSLLALASTDLTKIFHDDESMVSFRFFKTVLSLDFLVS